MNLEIWKSGLEASSTVRQLVYQGRDRHLAAFRKDVPRVVAKLSRQRAGTPGALHGCRLEIEASGGVRLTASAQSARLSAAVERAFRDAAGKLRAHAANPVATFEHAPA